MHGVVYPPARPPIDRPRPAAPAGRGLQGKVIAGLRGSHTHKLAVEAYQRHQNHGTGICHWCWEKFPCLSRLHAAAVIQAAGEEPAGYDPPPSRTTEQLSIPESRTPRTDYWGY